MKLKNIFAFALMVLPFMAMSQTNITFETQDYKTLGVYDTWEASPFREGVLKGNYAVIENHLIDVDEMLGVAPNSSGKILAVQRSRFGSNTFGVRIDLNETFELTPTTKYVHVKVYRPYSGRVMVVGLGKRRERLDQSKETEQFWAMSTSNIGAGKWHDVVLPIKGNGGIDIYSLVVVPDCESPHNYTEDAICYIDDIKVNNNPTSELVYEYYQVAFDKGTAPSRSDRHLNAIKLQCGETENQKATVSDKVVYTNAVARQFFVKPGETVTPSVDFTGSWMHAYAYIDYNNDGKFTSVVNDDFSIAEGSEIVSFSFYGGNDDNNGKNSAGTSISGNARNTLDMPSFKIPADIKPGTYRMRYKVDWNSIDPAGSIDQSNSILANGGGIVDIMLNVYDDYANVNDANRNGKVVAAENDADLVKYQTPSRQSFKIRMVPENGFEYSGIIVKYGYNLSGDSIVRDNAQWQKAFFERQEFDSDNCIEIPAACMCGDVEIEGLFVENGTYDAPEKRYLTSKVLNGMFVGDITWYTIQIGKDGYVIKDNGTADHIALNSKERDITDPAQLWCFVGDENCGYRIYNKNAGPTKVLAAPVEMLGQTGANSYPVLKDETDIPSDYIAVWRFIDSSELGSTGPEYAYMYEDGYEANKVNNRDSKLAFWNTGKDAGSTLKILYAETEIFVETIVNSVAVSETTKGIYDLAGRRVEEPAEGIYIVDGIKKYIVK
ncbi:MAG: hypothetical protein J6U58_00955 [Bacteroidaceae bacterium]|nr:hypothetical protein [Bacteroidaceae bacterium]